MRRWVWAGMALLMLVSLGLAQVSQRTATLTSKRASKWDATARYPIFSGSPVASFASAELRRMVNAEFSEFVKVARESERDGIIRHSWDLQMGVTPSIVRPNLVTVVLEWGSYTGGAHPNRFTRGLNFGLGRDGKPTRLMLRDLLAPGKTAEGLVKEVLIPAINRVKSARGTDALVSLDEGLEERFVVTPSGLTWMFEPYAVGSYAEGDYQVKLSFRELAGWVDLEGALKGNVKG